MVTISPILPSLSVCIFGPIQSSLWSVGMEIEDCPKFTDGSV